MPEPTDGQSAGSLSSSLLDLVRRREPEAWRRLTAVYSPVVYGWLRTGGLSAEDAADAAQEVFLAVAKNIDSFRRERPQDSFRGWLWTITRHKALDHHRRAAQRPAAPGGTTAHLVLQELPDHSDGSSTIPPEAAAAQVSARVMELVRAEVTEAQWQCFWRTTVQGNGPAEVARELGMTVGAVYKAKSRILARIRQQYGELLEG